MDSFFKKILSPFRINVIKAEEDELVDPQVVLRFIVKCQNWAVLNIPLLEECGQNHCAELQKKYDECNTRVNSKKKTSETCVEELVDFMECVDHCVAKTLFSKLK